ncbi:hypothetical protein [Paenibacillus roseipurpureus]|uniref:Uncharacterized protein n=1 Tax=Paenibacillus roseopurpureus TaxID=2918901 RepID=A0AA96LRF8_9BACL|nr:hypothetical protein [Paenibacillus sp. MBLB1832]WNR45206.1 hypothetical protein MJB10_03455 [Paenibacillus sp. MBLB1832]
MPTFIVTQLHSLFQEIPNDAISSLKVPAGRTVTAYADDNFAGTAWTFTSDNSNLTTTGNDNVISSFKIQSYLLIQS